MRRLIKRAAASACVCACSFAALAQDEAGPVVTPIAHPYPLSTCFISGEKLEADETLVKVIDGRELKFCCEVCVEDYADDPDAYAEKLDAAIIKAELMHYPIDTCIVGKGKLGSMGEPINLVYNNRMVRFCCGGCPPKFNADPDAYFAELDKKIIEAQIDGYPLDTCVVGGGALGSMGEPINVTYKNRLVRFCCKGCLPKFKKNPDEYMAMINAAYADKQRDEYPLKTCVVGKGELGSMGEPVEIVAGNTLVRFCCKGCLPGFTKEPQKYLAEIDAADK